MAAVLCAVVYSTVLGSLRLDTRVKHYFLYLFVLPHPLSPAVMPRFTEQVEAAVEALSANPTMPVDENEFIDASRLVYDGVRDIRKAVLMIRVRRI